MPNIEPGDWLANMYAGWMRETEPHPTLSLATWRYIFEDWARASTEPEKVTYKTTNNGGVDGIWVHPEAASSEFVMVYFHGGGFAVGSASSHRKLVGHIAAAMNVDAFLPEYRLAPENRFPAQVEDGVRAVRDLLASGINGPNIILAGDSAGGNLAITTALKLRDDAICTPRAIIGLSPWIDIDNASRSIDLNHESDVLVSRDGLEGYTTHYVGDNLVLRKDPLANPLHADLAGLPPVYLSTSSSEVLADDTIRFADKARAEGIDCEVSMVDGMQHVFQFMVGRHPAADDEVARIARWYQAL